MYAYVFKAVFYIRNLQLTSFMQFLISPSYITPTYFLGIYN
jgi:hypothetical protein